MAAVALLSSLLLRLAPLPDDRPELHPVPPIVMRNQAAGHVVHQASNSNASVSLAWGTFVPSCSHLTIFTRVCVG